MPVIHYLWCNLVRFGVYLDQILSLKILKFTIFSIKFLKNTIFSIKLKKTKHFLHKKLIF